MNEGAVGNRENTDSLHAEHRIRYVEEHRDSLEGTTYPGEQKWPSGERRIILYCIYYRGTEGPSIGNQGSFIFKRGQVKKPQGPTVEQMLSGTFCGNKRPFGDRSGK